MSLYRASDALMHHRDAIEDHLFGAIQSLFDVEQTVTLYDLTKPLGQRLKRPGSTIPGHN